MIRLPEIKTAELSTYGNFAKCHQAHFRVSRVGLGTRLKLSNVKHPNFYGKCVSLDFKVNWYFRNQPKIILRIKHPNCQQMTPAM